MFQAGIGSVGSFFGGLSMRRSTMAIPFIAALFVLTILLFPGVNGAIGGDSADRSMVTTESGNDRFFLETEEGGFILWDILGIGDRTIEVKVHVVNPDSDNSHDIMINLSTTADEDWSFKITEIFDSDGNDITDDERVERISGGTVYIIHQLDGGDQVTATIEASYKGNDNGVTETATVEGRVLGAKSFSASKTLTFETSTDRSYFIIIGGLLSLLGLGFAALVAVGLRKKEVGDEELKKLSGYIRDGAKAFLNSEYKVIGFFIAGVVIVLFVLALTLDLNWLMIPAFLFGALFSASAGNIGMRIATMANAKTAWACKESQSKGLRIAFNSGSVMGLTVVGLGLFGVSLLYFLFGDVEMLFGFGFGASSIALFARVGGGIYTKAADVGADLVGKVEAGIPEDDPRNPATIADNVGDNVGDVAGMGADLFESYVDSIIAAMALGTGGVSAMRGTLLGGGARALAPLLPLLLAGVGIISSIIGSLFVGGGKGHAHSQLNRGIWIAAGLMTASSLVIILMLFDTLEVRAALFVSMVVGLGAGILIGKVTEYYTSDHQKPTQRISEASTTGAGPNIIAGLGLGMISTAVPVLAVVVTIIVAFSLAGLYGIALAAVGMLSTLGITLATDTYGPVADNAAGLAEMAGMGKEVRKRAEELDAVGNTTAAIGKGFAIGSAGLTALALFSAFTQAANLDLSRFTLMNPWIVAGLFIGGLLPFVFSAMTMQAVGVAAQDMVEEVRRQFKSIKGIMEGEATPDYESCVAISTKGALKKMVAPSLLAVLVPIIVGSISMEALGGLLAGSIVTGFVLAVMMANAGGAWDNAKKYIESGHFGGKGSDAHKAAVVGDTVGDPFKDTSGPSLNILIKLMSIVSLVFVPLFFMVNTWLGGLLG